MLPITDQSEDVKRQDKGIRRRSNYSAVNRSVSTNVPRGFASAGSLG